jgi:acetyl esterase/lipase
LGAPTAAEPSSDADGVLHLPARTIPLPKTISPEAQAFLVNGAAMLMASASAAGQPALNDKPAWRARNAAIDKAYEPIAERMLAASPATVETKVIGGVTVCIGTPNAMRRPDRARMIIHGGGWMMGGGKGALARAAAAAAASGCTAYSVDYTLLPDGPFPIALDQCVAVYRELIKLHDPKKMAISGESAGGNLTAVTALKVRDLGLPLPGALGILTPVTDLTNLSDSLVTNYGVDVVLSRPLGDINILYGGGQDLKDPYISPVFADFSKGYPPALLQTGTRDLLLSDTVRLHRALLKAGMEAELHVWEGMPHAGFGGYTPEDREVVEQFERFMDKHLA